VTVIVSLFSERERDVRYRPMLSPVRLSVVCRLSVALVHPTEPVEIFGNFSTPFGISTSVEIDKKFHGDRPRQPLRRGS